MANKDNKTKSFVVPAQAKVMQQRGELAKLAKPSMTIVPLSVSGRASVDKQPVNVLSRDDDNFQLPQIIPVPRVTNQKSHQLAGGAKTTVGLHMAVSGVGTGDRVGAVKPGN